MMVFTSHIHLTEAEGAALFDYIRAVADELGLRDWDIDLQLHPAPEGLAAQIHIPYGRRAAQIYLGPAWRDHGAEDLRNTIVHELLHIHLHDLNSCSSLIEDHLAPAVADVFNKALIHRLEQAVDALASAIAAAFPLPPYGEELAELAKKFRRRKGRAARDSSVSGGG